MARPRLTRLSIPQEKIAKAINRMRQVRETVFVSELVKHLGLAAESSLTAALRIMERNGFAAIDGGGGHGKTRTVRLTPAGQAAIGVLTGIPLIGRIQAGKLHEAVSEPEEMVTGVEGLLDAKPRDFLLRVVGDSMTPEIQPGDLVLLRPNIEVEQGEIAAVTVGEDYDATLKRVHLDHGKKQITLRARNPQYADLTVDAAEVAIAGVFRGLIRKGA
ncbi:MAG: repressor LexA [Chthoniobacter sp.]|jgi:repressor LexA|nr:repressor LexA [Chthoniobacter sp.]